MKETDIREAENIKEVEKKKLVLYLGILLSIGLITLGIVLSIAHRQKKEPKKTEVMNMNNLTNSESITKIS